MNRSSNIFNTNKEEFTMTRTLKQFFATHYPGMPIEDACQSILDELGEIEVRYGVDTGTFKSLVETILEDLTDNYTDADPDDDY